jgi:hypothetical protein
MLAWDWIWSNMAGTNIVVGEHKALVDTLEPSIALLQPPSVLLNHLTEYRPLNAANVAPLLPCFGRWECTAVVVLSHLLVEPGYDLFASVHPLIPVFPNKWPTFTLRAQKFDTFM